MEEHKSLLPSQNERKTTQNDSDRKDFDFDVGRNVNDDIDDLQLSDFSEVETSDMERLLQSDNDLTIIERSNHTVIRRRVGLLHAVALLVGQIIGSGIFISPTIVLKNSGSLGLTLIIWTLGGFLTMLGTLCYCELGTMIEKSGGDYVYLKISYGKLASFLYSWLNVWFIDPASFAIKSLTFSLYFTAVFKTGCNDVILLKLLAAISLVLLSAINCASVSFSAKTQVVFTAAKLLGILMIVCIGITQLAKGETQNFNNAFANSANSPGMIGHAIYAVMWSYSGFANLNVIAEELKNPEKNFIRSMCISIPLITLCYVSINVSYFTVLSPTEMLSSNAVAFTFADKLSPVFGVIMPLIVATSCIGSINSSVFSASRALFSMSRENQLPKLFSLVHRDTQTPIPAILLRCVLGALILLPASIEPMLNCILFVEWIIYGLMFFAVLLLRWKKPHLQRPYKVPLIIPIMLLPISIYFIIIPFISNPIESVVGLTIIAAGIPVYYVFLVKQWIPKKVSRFLGYSGYTAHLLCNVVEPAIPKSFLRY